MATAPNSPKVPQAVLTAATPDLPNVTAIAEPEVVAETLQLTLVPTNDKGPVYPVGTDTAPCNWRIAIIKEDDSGTYIEAISNLSNLTFRGTPKEFSKYLKGM